MSIYIIVDSDELEFYCMERFGIENEVVSDYLSNREDYYKFFEQFKKEEIIDIYCHITPTIFSKYINILMINGYKCKGGCNITMDDNNKIRLMQTMIKENSNILYDMSNFLKS